MNINTDKLIQEYKEQRKKTITDSYSMSIGEIVSLYQDGEIDIHPEFQRFFRWTDEQKSKLIESILTGIPLPSFFVATADNGTWDVLDGVQRLSTIFSFLGVYKNADVNLAKKFKLTSLENLKNFKELTFDQLPEEIIRTFKREKINIVIIKQESDEHSKYELFQRLNTNGSSLSDQEVRNCLLIMHNKEFFKWFENLSKNSDFMNSICISERLELERYHQELLARFIVFTNRNIENAEDNSKLNQIGQYITEELLKIASDLDQERFKKKFELVFLKFNEALAEKSFYPFDSNKLTHKGPFRLTVFETLALGIGQLSLEQINQLNTEQIKEVSKKLSQDATYMQNHGSGVGASRRLSPLIKLGKDLFTKELS
jgi:uncharacterized protein with ParB-like and HNH nuclease domain